MPGLGYSAERFVDNGVTIVRLTDATRGAQVSVASSIGNRAYEFRVKGENFLYFPFHHPAELAGSRHLNGIPFLAPWANRMPDGFYSNGSYHRFDPSSGSLRLDPNGVPIHGMLTSSPYWQVTDIHEGADSCHVTSRLEFWRHAELMANWPLPHDYEMTYRLSQGTLEVNVRVINRSAAPMPVAIGFHPYFQLPGLQIEEAVARVPARHHVETDARLIATGEMTSVSFNGEVALKDHRFDDGFTDLIRSEDNRAVFSVEAGGEKISVAFGPKYHVGIVYSPPGQNFICFEPMTAITNGINLAHEGKYPDLQTIAPGGCWDESFWVMPEIS
jgi:aldose 1-epimerase